MINKNHKHDFPRYGGRFNIKTSSYQHMIFRIKFGKINVVKSGLNMTWWNHTQTEAIARIPILKIKPSYLYNCGYMISGQGNTFRIVGHLWGESMGHRCMESPHEGPMMLTFDGSLLLARISYWINITLAGDLRSWRNPTEKRNSTTSNCTY